MTLPATSSAWPDILARVQKRISSQQYTTWFQNLRASMESPEELVIRAPNNFFKEWLAQNYLEIIEDSAAEATGSRPRVRFVIDANIRVTGRDETPSFPAASSAPSAPAMAPSRDDRAPIMPQGIRLNEHYTFDTFVIGPSNQLAHAASMAVAQSPGQNYNPLFLYGAVGLGKSHLLQAICHDCLPRLGARRIAYLSCETFVNEFISAIQRNDLNSFRTRYRQLDILFLDDIQFLSRAERSQEEFFHTFNDLHNAQKQIVLSSDQPPHEISGLQERLISRFKSGLVARIDPPSYEMRVAILNRKAELRSVKVPSDVIEFIATIVTTNIRELDGAITKIIGYASLLNQPISLDVAREALHEPLSATPVTVEEIIKVVTGHYNVRVSDLQSRKRTRSIVLPRQVCMYLARALTSLSLEEIGGYFGGRDHSTVLHAEDKIRKESLTDAALARTLQELQHTIGRSPGTKRSGDR